MNEELNSTPVTSPATPAYENNPFYVATNGIDLLFKKAQSIGIMLAVLTGISALSSLPSMFTPSSSHTNTAETSTTSHAASQGLPQLSPTIWLFIVLAICVVFLFAVFIGIIYRGILDYTAAELANNRPVTISEAFRAIFADFWSYTWLLTIQGVKIFLWTLLFIIPGIIMSVRYSLAGVSFFDKKLKGDTAIKDSVAMTKGLWLTTFASQNLFNLITLGFIKSIVAPGTNATLYRQYNGAGGVKPKAHVLSWLTLLIPLAIGVLLMLVFILILGYAFKDQPVG